MTQPLACELSSPDLQRRKSGLLTAVRAQATSVKPIANGVRLDLPPSPTILADILDLIRLESACCPFLQFQLKTGPRGERITLRVRGPKGTASFLARLGWVTATRAKGSEKRS